MDTRFTTIAFSLLAACTLAVAGQYTVSISGREFLLNGQPLDIVGLRCSNALMTEATTNQLIDNLDTFAGYGVNTVSVFFMGSRFGDIKGYLPDASLDPTYRGRMARVIEAADQRGMIVLIGCLYWGASRAKEDLGAWTQSDANDAVASTVRWLGESNYRNVLVDPDNEGMAVSTTGWSVSQMIDAAHAVDPTIVVGNNTGQTAANADFNCHFGPKQTSKPWFQSEGTPNNAPGGYWGSYSKEDGYYNYIRIGRYTADMKADQKNQTTSDISNWNGHMLASTWLQCAPAEGVNGPFMVPGGLSNIANVDADVTTTHADAGIGWWLEWVRATYGAYIPPGADTSSPPPDTSGQSCFEEQGGVLCVEAESFHQKFARVPTGGSVLEHRWDLMTDRAGYSGDGFMVNLPDERCETCTSPSSPRDNSGADLLFRVKVNTAGTYRVWVRGMSMGGQSNGVHVGIDGYLPNNGPGSNISGFRPENTWVWEHGHKEYSVEPNIYITAGMHTLHIWGRDDGFRFDKVLLSISQPAAPSGSGPAESVLVAGGAVGAETAAPRPARVPASPHGREFTLQGRVVGTADAARGALVRAWAGTGGDVSVDNGHERVCGR